MFPFSDHHPRKPEALVTRLIHNTMDFSRETLWVSTVFIDGSSGGREGPREMTCSPVVIGKASEEYVTGK
jgi:hypothetical protein